MTDPSVPRYYPERGYEAYPMSEKARWGSQGSMAGSVHQSMASLYTPSVTASRALPIAQSMPDPEKQTEDNMGLSCFSIFINPPAGIVAVHLSEKARIYYNKCKYKKAARYGHYAKCTALFGIASMLVVLFIIFAATGNYYARFRDW